MNAQMPYLSTLSNSPTPYSLVSQRLVDRKLNVIRRAVCAVQKQTGQASGKDVAVYLGVSLDEYNHILQDANTYHLLNNSQQEVT